MTTLQQLLARTSALPSEGTVYVRGPVTPESSAVVVVDEAAAPDDFDYLLEVALIMDVLTTWSSWRAGRLPTASEVAEAVIHYAENDAYLPIA